MRTSEYRTKTIMKEMDNRPLCKDYWPVGLDIGYSGVKVFSPNAAVCFPAYAVKNEGVTHMRIGGTDDRDPRSILYRDETGEWEVGALAQNRISVSDTSAGSLAIYGRSRYYSPMFKVLLRVGMASGMRTNRYGEPGVKPIKVISGLPPKYLRNDAPDLKAVLSGKHEFEVCFGNGPWEHFSFTLTENDIGIIDQPQGTLFSISTNSSMGLMADAQKYFKSRVLVIDPGFGTMDLFPMLQGAINRDNCQTFPELGMKQVLKQTTEEIYEKYHFEIAVPAFQKFLEDGTVIRREGRKLTKVPFDDILEKNSREVCEQAIERLMEIYNPPLEFDYMVLSGGTGAAWSNWFRNSEYFRDCDTVSIISGNQGDPSLPYIFSNVRGYYIFAFSCFRR